MSSKLDRAMYGPSWMEIFFGILLSVVIGVIAGFLILALKPVPTVKEIPKDAPPGQVYYIPGSKASVSGPAMEKKEKALIAGQTVTFNEEELDFVFMPTGKDAPVPGPKPGAKGGPPAPTYSLAASHPNFRIHDNLLQMSAVVTVSVFGASTDVIVQSDGRFEREDGVYTYVPSAILVGCCPLDRLPFIPALLKKRVVAALDFPPDLAAAWSKLSEVGIEGKNLKLVGTH